MLEIKKRMAGAGCAWARLGVLGVMLIVACTGCGFFKSNKQSVFIPMQPTATEQFRYAEVYKAGRNLALIPADQGARFRKTREIVRLHYEKVVEYFPGDRFDTPLAKLTLLEMQAGLDAERVKASERTVRKTIEQLIELCQEYPEMEFIQAKGQYDQALCHQLLGEFQDAGVCYFNVWKQFEHSTNPHIKNLSDRSKLLYNQTQVPD